MRHVLLLVFRMGRVQKWYQQWNLLKFGKRDLETVLFNAPAANSSHRARRSWVLDLLDWIHARSRLIEINMDETELINARIQLLLKTLQRSENFKTQFAHAIQDYLLKSEAVSLFANTGVPNHGGFVSEFIARIHYKLLPQAPQDFDLSMAVIEAFSNSSNQNWLKTMDSETFRQFFEILAKPELKEHFHQQIEDAILLLSIEVRATGLSAPLRERLTIKNLREIPFFLLGDQARAMVELKDKDVRNQQANLVLKVIDECFAAIRDVYAHLSDFGVSVGIVYQLDRVKLQLSRMRTLVLLTVQEDRLDHLQSLLSSLVADLARSRSLSALFAENLSLLSKKISDRSAQTGEHYITRSREEMKVFFHSALGGGFLTGFTVLIKFMVVALPLAPFLIGFAASLNYAVSFVLIQLCGFTLATKQPSMTATALAAKMEKLNDAQALKGLVDEIIHLVRSQVIAVFGNLLAVIPTVVILDLMAFYGFGHHIIDEHHAHESLASVSIIGPAVAFGAFTGILLFISSQVAGWVDNWWVFYKMSPALRYNRKLQFIFGDQAAARIALFFGQSIGGLSGNISLGFLLGMLPVVFKFFGLPLDIRHVTLSTGMVASSISTLGLDQAVSLDFLFVILGVLGIGFANVVTAFFCSML